MTCCWLVLFVLLLMLQNLLLCLVCWCCFPPWFCAVCWFTWFCLLVGAACRCLSPLWCCLLVGCRLEVASSIACSLLCLCCAQCHCGVCRCLLVLLPHDACRCCHTTGGDGGWLLLTCLIGCDSCDRRCALCAQVQQNTQERQHLCALRARCGIGARYARGGARCALRARRRSVRATRKKDQVALVS